MFYSPKNENELKEILCSKKVNDFVIAGGTDLIIHLKNNKITDYNIIDITKIDGWNYIKEDENNYYIGALVTMTQLYRSEIVKTNLKAIYRSAYELGSDQIRNRATIGGNVANASQSADVMLALFAYDAKVKIFTKDKEKIVDIRDFVIGREKTILNQDELISEIIVPKKDRVSAFRKVGSRIAVTISKVSCAIDMSVKDGKVSDISVYLGAVGVKPTNAKLIEEYFLNNKLDEIELSKLQDIAYKEIELAIPTRESKYYKRVAIEGLIEDILGDLR